MSNEPKINLPSIRGGQQVVNAPNRTVTSNANEPKISFPTISPEEKFKNQVSADTRGDRARLRGLTFGLSDRVEALVKPGKYEDNLKVLQQDRDEYREESPWAAYGNELLTGVASGGAITGLARKGLAKVAPSIVEYAKGVGLGPLAARLAGPLTENAAFGELAHQAEQAPGQVGNNFGQGAAAGAAAGAVLGAGGKLAGVAGRGASKVGQRLALAAGAIKPESFANRKFVGALQQANMTPEEVGEAARFLRGDDLAQHGPVKPGEHELPDLRTPVRIADVLPVSARNVVKKGIRASDKAQAEVTEMVANRNAEQGMRLQDHVESTLSNDTDSTAALDALAQQRSRVAGPHYDEAYKVGTVKDPIVDTWIKDRKVNAKIFQELKKSLDDNASAGMGEGKPMKAVLDINKKGEFEWKVRPSVEDLDTIKKHIDSKIGELWDPIQMKYRKPKKLGEPDAEQLKNQRADLIGMIDKLTPDGKGGSHYANARKAFADDSELIDAQRAGMAVIRQRPEDVAKIFDNFSHRPELQQQFRSGLSASIKDLLDKADTNGGAAIVRKLWGTPQMQKKLEYVMADSPTAEQFRRMMGAEKAFIDTQKNMVPKSGGQDLLADAEGFSLPLAAANALSGRFGSAANHLGRFGAGAISGVVPEVGDDLARIAMMNPEQYDEWVKALRAREKRPGAKVVKAAGALGTVAGRGFRVSGAAVGGKLPAMEQSNGTNEDE